jgi:hypothetical protein
VDPGHVERDTSTYCEKADRPICTTPYTRHITLTCVSIDKYVRIVVDTKESR